MKRKIHVLLGKAIDFHEGKLSVQVWTIAAGSLEQLQTIPRDEKNTWIEQCIVVD